MYYPDLTPYTFCEWDPDFDDQIPAPALNVGWLDYFHQFPKWKAAPPPEFLNNLFELCFELRMPMQGFHRCQLCWFSPLWFSPFALSVSRNGKELMLGSAEIRVSGTGNKVYAAPNLIYHYVEKHRYKPPEDFIKAVLSIC